MLLDKIITCEARKLILRSSVVHDLAKNGSHFAQKYLLSDPPYQGGYQNIGRPTHRIGVIFTPPPFGQNRGRSRSRETNSARGHVLAGKTRLGVGPKPQIRFWRPLDPRTTFLDPRQLFVHIS